MEWNWILIKIRFAAFFQDVLILIIIGETRWLMQKGLCPIHSQFISLSQSLCLTLYHTHALNLSLSQ